MLSARQRTFQVQACLVRAFGRSTVPSERNWDPNEIYPTEPGQVSVKILCLGSFCNKQYPYRFESVETHYVMDIKV